MTPDTNKERADFENFWRDTRGERKARRELVPHDKQPQTYISDSANRHYVTWRAARASLAANAPAAEPVATVYTMEALVPGGSVKHHVQLLKPLPAGTPLYTAPPAPTEQWRDIETAPRDGTEVLLWREDCGQFIGRYTSCDAFPLTQDEIDATDEETLFAKDWFTQWPQALRLEGSEVPTRWRHLPDDPAPPQGAAKGANDAASS